MQYFIWTVGLLLTFTVVPSSSAKCSVKSKKVCYPPLGCFPLGPPWTTLWRQLPIPFAPEKIETKAYLFTKSEVGHEVLLRPDVSLNGATLLRNATSVFIIHGFAADASLSWVSNLKNAYLKNKPANVFIIDWGPGAQHWNYMQVASNTRVVGSEIARLINELNLDLSKVHFIGHSLGAHIAAYAANKCKGTVGRITGLDPAAPVFEGFSHAVTLDPSDAEFVDVLHTDARPLIPTLGVGVIKSVGHVDFYMNGGFEQPGCTIPNITSLPFIGSLQDLAKFPVEILSNFVYCAHGRSHEYFTEALSNGGQCTFWGHQAGFETWARSFVHTFTQGAFHKLTAFSSKCTRQDCTPIGLKTPEFDIRGTFVVTTNSRAPYCSPEPGVQEETTESTTAIAPMGNWFKPLFDFTI